MKQTRLQKRAKNAQAKREAAFRQGRKDCQAGIPFSKRPGRLFSAEAFAWADGWVREKAHSVAA